MFTIWIILAAFCAKKKKNIAGNLPAETIAGKELNPSLFDPVRNFNFLRL